jgi:CspA family cold shock protein
MTILLRLLLSAVLAFVSILLIQITMSGAINLAAISFASVIIIFIACAIAMFISPSLDSINIGFSGLGLSSADREQGTVKWFNVSKGYGFVTRSNGEDIFVHFRSIRGKGRRILREGQIIEFTLIDGDKGPQAEDVEPL